MIKMISNIVEIKLNNDETVKLFLNFKMLLKVKNNYPDDYYAFNKIVSGNSKEDIDFFEILSVIYVAYLCANFDSKTRYTKNEFIMLVPFNITLIKNTQNRLLGISKN